MSFIFNIFLLITTSVSSAQECKNLLSNFEKLLFMSKGEIKTITDVEVFRLNNDMGPQQFGSLTFVQSSEISFVHDEAYSFVGLTADGILYHVISYNNERTIARRINGKVSVVDFKLTSLGRLLITDGQNTFVFSSQLWLTPASKLALKKWKDFWQISSAVGIGLKYIFWHDVFLPVSMFSYSIPIPAIEIGMIGLGAFTSAFTALYSYEDYNKNPNGLVLVPIDFESENWFTDPDIVRASENNLNYFSITPLGELPVKLDPELSSSIEE